MPAFANLEKFSSPVEARDAEERRSVLMARITSISLVYANSKFLHERQKNPEYKFSDAVRSFSPIKNIILQPIFNLNGLDWRNKKTEIAKTLDEFFDQMDEAYSRSGFAADTLYALVASKIRSIKNDLSLEDWPQGEKVGSQETKILAFNDVHNIEYDAEGKYLGLTELGFSRLHEFVEIHVKDFYASSEQSLGPELIKNDLSSVAEYIIDKKPQTAAVVGQSWLLDTPLAARLGFTKIEGDAPDQNDFSTWLQFIDRYGQIDKKRFEAFSFSGELPHKSVKAYIKTEEFLRRYLPDKRRGEVDLLEIDPERERSWHDRQAQAEVLREAWNESLKTGGFEFFMSRAGLLSELLSGLPEDGKREYLEFLRLMHDKRVPFSEVYKYKEDSIRELDRKIQELASASLYRKKTVRI